MTSIGCWPGTESSGRAPAEVPVFLQSAGYPYLDAPGPYIERPVSWPTPSVAAFQSWVKHLRSSDNQTLGQLNVPPLATLQRIAARPRIHDFVLDQASARQLRSFLADPAVRTIKIGDVAYNLDSSGQP